MRAITIAAVLLTASPAFADEPDLTWLSGHWRSEAEGRISEEIWTTSEGGIMLGMGRSLRDGEARSFEFLMIHFGEETVYHAQPGGRPPVSFTLVEASDSHAVFENAGHDFPQRITYRREGGELHAEISDLAGERSFSWSWTRLD
jgi:hypothetical protein